MSKRKKKSSAPLKPPTARGRPKSVQRTSGPNGKPSVVQRGTRRVRRLATSIYRACTKKHSFKLGTFVRTTLGFFLAIWGGATQFGYGNSKALLPLWIALFALHLVLTRLRRGTVIREYADAVERVNSNLAGTIDDLTRYMTRGKGQRVTHDEAHALTFGLLACIRDYTTVAMQLGTDHMVRVSLAVPLDPSDPRTDLRVWCYDDNHANRRWSTLLFGWEGAPTAYATGKIQVLDDVNEALQRLGVNAPPREFKSVVCIPVHVGGRSSRVVGVVNIDVREAGFFTETNVQQQVFPLVAPAVSQIGTVLTVKEEGPYAFER